MAVICLIGAGSNIFAKNVIGDCLCTPALHGSTIRLFDIDPVKLDLSRRLIEKLNVKLDAHAKIEATTDRRQALKDADYVLIHDGARPFVSGEIIERCIQGAKERKACVAGMPVKDTIKLADNERNIAGTPERSKVWMIQTPQAFEYPLIKEAYTILIEQERQGRQTSIPVTDDAMVVETLLGEKVKLVEGSYRNIKITTPEDIGVAESFLKG